MAKRRAAIAVPENPPKKLSTPPPPKPKARKTGQAATTSKIQIAPPPKPKEEKVNPAKAFVEAQKAITHAAEFWNEQRDFAQFNHGVNWQAFHDDLVGLNQIYEEKGAMTRRDLQYDWAEYQTQVREWESRFAEAIKDEMVGRATRMIENSDLSEEEVGEMWSPLTEAGPHKQIRILAKIISDLRARGFRDPRDEVRGHRQSGGNRRRR
jgi:hypothetical protein